MAYVPSLKKAKSQTENVKYTPSLQRGQRKQKIEQMDVPAPVVNLPAPVVNVPAPVVNVPAPVVNVPAPVVNVPAPVVNVPAPVVNVPAPVVNVPAPVVNVPAPVVNVPAPVVNITYDDKHLSVLIDLLKKMNENNVEETLKLSQQASDEAMTQIRDVLEKIKKLDVPISTNTSDGDVELDGGSALRFLSNIETKISALGELQIVHDSLVDSGNRSKFKTSNYDLLVALVASTTQLFNDVGTLHNAIIKLQRA